MKKYKSLILYGVFGVLTTLVNIVSYYICAQFINLSVVVSTCISWLIAVIFAYVTNKIWVFESNNHTLDTIIKEITSFFSCRILTGILDVIIMYIFVDELKFNDIVIKTLSNILVIILNYVASKLLIFKDHNKSKKIKYNKKEICIALFILFLSVLFMMNSPLNIIIRGQSTVDSSVFRYIGMLISKGYTPYLNTFDHKGPIIYLLNYFGFMIHKTCGIWLIEVIFMFITFYFVYKIAKLKTKPFLALIVLLLSTVNLFIYFEGGNLVEEYALTFITISTYIFFDYLLNDKITKLRIIVCGFCFACVCLLRINMIPCWIVFCIAILIKCLKEKDYKKLINYVLNFLVGALIIVIPISLWLISKNAFGEFINDYFIFNMKYTANVDKFGKLSTLIFFTNSTTIMFALLINIYAIVREKKKDIFVINLLYILLSLLMAGLSGREYLHYGMILIPSLIMPFMYFINLFGKNTNKEMFTLVIIYLLVTIVLPQWLATSKNVSSSASQKRNGISPIDSDFLQVSELIQKNTTKKDKITVYGNSDYIYYLSNRLSASKYSYQRPIGEVNPKIFDEYFKELQKNKPIIIVSCGEPDKRMKNFIKKYSYKRLKNKNEKIFVVYKLYN